VVGRSKEAVKKDLPEFLSCIFDGMPEVQDQINLLLEAVVKLSLAEKKL